MTLEAPWDFMRVQKRLRKYSASSFRLLSCLSNPQASLLLLYVNLTLLDFTVALDFYCDGIAVLDAEWVSR